MISIIVPVYKSEKTLDGCLKSLLAQTMQDIEIICVIDGSPDRCGEICDEFAKNDARVKVIKRENGGVSSARNRGIEEASGKYVAFVDSDDTVEADYCEKLMQSLEASGADLAICGFHHWYMGRDVEKRPENPGVFQTSDYREEFLKLYQSGFLNMPWNKLFKKEKAGTFPVGLSLGEDLLFNMDYLERCDRIAVIPHALYHYIQEESGTTLSSQKRADKLEIAKTVCRRVSDYDRRLSGNEGLHPIIAGKFVMEFLDDCEKLPFDGALNTEEKRAFIKKLSENQDFCAANAVAEVTAPDYRLLQWCFQKNFTGLILPLCAVRKWIVKIMRCLWKR